MYISTQFPLNVKHFLVVSASIDFICCFISLLYFVQDFNKLLLPRVFHILLAYYCFESFLTIFLLVKLSLLGRQRHSVCDQVTV